MTKDDEARLLVIRDAVARGAQLANYETFLLRLLDEARAERDACREDVQRMLEREQAAMAKYSASQHVIVELRAKAETDELFAGRLFGRELALRAQVAALTEAGNALAETHGRQCWHNRGQCPELLAWQAAICTRAEGEGKGG